MAKLRIRSDGEGQSTRVEIDGVKVDGLESVVWMVHGRKGKAKCFLCYHDSIEQVVAKSYGDMDVDIEADVPGETSGDDGQ